MGAMEQKPDEEGAAGPGSLLPASEKGLNRAASLAWVPRNPVEAVLEVIREGERFLVCSHSRPDGDAVGSMLATGMLLEQLGKRAELVTADRIPSIYRGLPGADAIRTMLRVHGPCDAVILLECDGLERAKVRGLEP